MQNTTFSLLPKLNIPQEMDGSTIYNYEYLQLRIKTEGVAEESTTGPVRKWCYGAECRSCFGRFPHVFVFAEGYLREQDGFLSPVTAKLCVVGGRRSYRSHFSALCSSSLAALQHLSSQLDNIPKVRT